MKHTSSKFSVSIDETTSAQDIVNFINAANSFSKAKAGVVDNQIF